MRELMLTRLLCFLFLASSATAGFGQIYKLPRLSDTTVTMVNKHKLLITPAGKIDTVLTKTEYYQNGYMMKQIIFHWCSGSSNDTITFTYDSLHRVANLRDSKCFPKERLVFNNTYKYNERNDLTEYYRLESSGDTMSIELYDLEYNKEGILIEKRGLFRFRNEDEYSMVRQYTYDKNGNRTKILFIDYEVNTFIMNFEFDDQGREILLSSVLQNVQYKYDISGRLTEEINKRREDKESTHYLYYNNGLIKKETKYFNDEDFEKLNKAKGELSWIDFIMQLAK